LCVYRLLSATKAPMGLMPAGARRSGASRASGPVELSGMTRRPMSAASPIAPLSGLS
jgi:hypothetical protein